MFSKLQRSVPRVLFSDLDGTILHGNEALPSRANISALARLGAEGILRVIVTGRNAQSTMDIVRGWPQNLVDYIIFSSGVGALRVSDGALLKQHALTPAVTSAVARRLRERKLDFFIHEPAPLNHQHRWADASKVLPACGDCTLCADAATDAAAFAAQQPAVAAERTNPDFYSRWSKTESSGAPLAYCHIAAELPAPFAAAGASQFLVVVPPPPAEVCPRTVADELRADLASLCGADSLSVVLATSPIDHASLWLEVTPPNVDKGSAAAAFLEAQYGAEAAARARVLAVGNDYNDLALLAWAAARAGETRSLAALCANAPAPLHAEIEATPNAALVPACAADGFAAAVSRVFFDAEVEPAED